MPGMASTSAGNAAPVVEPHSSVLSWDRARATARDAGEALPVETRPLHNAHGRALAAPLIARTDLPSFDTSAMDGWAVSGPGPWRLTGGEVLAGDAPSPLATGDAVGIATGAPLPPGATSVLRHEHGRVDGERLTDLVGGRTDGQDVRPRGRECAEGDVLLPAGTAITPAVLGMAAAAGYDRLEVHQRPSVELLVLGDELLDSGTPRDGRVRDALSPMLQPWLRTRAEVIGCRRLPDELDALREAIAASTADVVITTGSTAAGPVDHLHTALGELGARLLVDSVAVRPGHPMLLAALPDGGRLVGLPGNPLAAVAGVVTLAMPLLDRLGGHSAVEDRTARAGDLLPHPESTRLVPVQVRDGVAQPLAFGGPAMLRGLTLADGLAVLPPSEGPPPEDVVLLPLGWG
ncbi:molybdopterin molybdotransferase [Saccharopolyspora flava]|uniref:Molybdopterin molybdenumtransferase n=2 Tax=Saccharopolyspora flava TaxID=95161 RepID=A0A1I6SE29_9PSEU|nr:molybdopterin molybdotransferase [Saccharopolyspora flava]